MGFYLRNSSYIGAVRGTATGVYDIKTAFLNTSKIALKGTSVYDAVNFGPVYNITELEQEFQTLYPGVVSGYMKYVIRDSASTTKTIVTSFRKSAAGKLSQSCFSAYNNAISIGAVSSILLYSNDDHDTLFMDADGGGVLSRSNINTLNGNFDKFFGTTVTVTNSAINTAMQFSPSNFISSSQNGSIIAFPSTSSAIWFNFSTSQYKVNNFSAQSFTSDLSTYIGGVSPANNLITISDGVNMFLIYKTGQSFAVEGTVNLTTGVVTTINRSFSQSFFNTTEEDMIGAQLFALDGALSYQNSTSFNYTPLNNASTTYGWRDITTFSASNTAAIGTLATQTGMDIYGSIDTSDGYVWFADWGHDDGGLFNVGNDSQLGTAKSNIQLIPSTYTN